MSQKWVDICHFVTTCYSKLAICEPTSSFFLQNACSHFFSNSFFPNGWLSALKKDVFIYFSLHESYILNLSQFLKLFSAMLIEYLLFLFPMKQTCKWVIEFGIANISICMRILDSPSTLSNSSEMLPKKSSLSFAEDSNPWIHQYSNDGSDQSDASTRTTRWKARENRLNRVDGLCCLSQMNTAFKDHLINPKSIQMILLLFI